MAKRSKRLKKQIIGLQKQIEKHELKILTELGRKDTTQSYWANEISKKFHPQILQRKSKLSRKKKR